MSGRRKSSNRAFVVLGMHRSGTSATTRALQALGVELGDQLLGPVPEENPLGFFEDEPILEICERVFDVLGMTWDSPKLISAEAWADPRLRPLELAAARSLRERFGDRPNLGFKNPRTARQLPFWKRVLSRLGRVPTYLIVLRDPLSVAASLSHRNGIAPERGQLLWLLHMTEAVLNSSRSLRVAVEYDALVREPGPTLARLADRLDLPRIASSEADRAAFEADFLSRDLQNFRHSQADLEVAPALSALTRKAYALLLRSARDDASLAPSALQRGFRQIDRRLRDLEPVFEDLAATETARTAERETARSERAARASLSEVAEARALSLAQAEAAATADARQIEDLRGALAQRAEAEAQRTEAEAQQARALEESLTLSAQLGAQLEAAATAQAELSEQQEASRQALARAEAERRTAEAEAQALRLSAEEAQRRADTQQARVEAAERAAAEHAARTRAEQASVRAERAREQAAARRRQTELLERLEEAEATRFRDRITLDELRRENRDREADLVRTEADQRAASAASQGWIQEQAHQWSRQYLVQVRAMAKTRQWRLTRLLQQTVSRLRGRPWQDGLAHLEGLVQTLSAEAEREPADLRLLASRMAEIRQTVSLLSSGELFRASRAAATAFAAIRGLRREDGPFEFVRNRAGELQFAFEHLAFAPRPEPRGPSAFRPADASAIVDIVIPVYGAKEQSLRCIQSVLQSAPRTPHEIVVIDDASGDDGLRRQLRRWAEQGQITHLENERNLGFPATANRGLALHSDRDVVLLNSDTQVQGDWLDRLRRSAQRDWKVATATPFSNNAEICSYPVLCQSAAMPSPEDLAALDERAARVNAAQTVTIPTAVGFCMYIRREALRVVGDFDAERFGRGYGEENDFCLRARAQGFRHVLAADVFVAHEGGVSFSDAKAALVEQGLVEIDRLYPGYRAEIQAFIEADPVRPLRGRLSAAEMAPTGQPAILMLSHAKGGGTHRHVLELSGQLEKQGIPSFLLQPLGPHAVRLTRPGAPAGAAGASLSGASSAETQLEFELPAELDLLIETLRLANVRHVHHQHLLGLPPSVGEIARLLGCAYDVTLHDYIAICPRIHLMDERGRYCELPSAEGCNTCIKRNGSEAGFEVKIEDWRRSQLDWLLRARRVFVPSEDARTRQAPLLPGVELVVRPHSEATKIGARLGEAAPRRGVRRVAVIGAIGAHKGAEVLQACAEDAAARKLPLEFRLVGYSDRDSELLSTKKVSITGPYEEAELESLLRDARCQLALLPSTWPETYCYTLSAALRWQLYPVAFDLGAVAERMERVGWGETLSLSASAKEINDHLLGVSITPCPVARVEHELGARYADYRSDYYESPAALVPEVSRNET